MKQVTLNFREVAVDGLPKKSGYCAVVYRSSVDQELEPLPLSQGRELKPATIGKFSYSDGVAPLAGA